MVYLRKATTGLCDGRTFASRDQSAQRGAGYPKLRSSHVERDQPHVALSPALGAGFECAALSSKKEAANAAPWSEFNRRRLDSSFVCRLDPLTDQERIGFLPEIAEELWNEVRCYETDAINQVAANNLTNLLRKLIGQSALAGAQCFRGVIAPHHGKDGVGAFWISVRHDLEPEPGATEFDFRHCGIALGV